MDSATDSLDSEFFARTSRFSEFFPNAMDNVHWATMNDIDMVRHPKFAHAELTRWGIFCRDCPRRPCQRPRISRENFYLLWNETVVYVSTVKITQIF